LTSKWLGVTSIKCPLDLWVYQEILFEIRPSLIIESGTLFGGSAYYLASICDLVTHGRIVTIDPIHRPNRPSHARIQYVEGSSLDPSFVQWIRQTIQPEDVVLVILDSDHHRTHVLQELEIYSEFVTPGSYLIVEDTNINGHPTYPGFGPGPMEAVDEFLWGNRDFSIDRDRERFLLTMNPRGYLRRHPPCAHE
jgi:cephalosporin hydroxylase